MRLVIWDAIAPIMTSLTSYAEVYATLSKRWFFFSICRLVAELHLKIIQPDSSPRSGQQGDWHTLFCPSQFIITATSMYCGSAWSHMFQTFFICPGHYEMPQYGSDLGITVILYDNYFVLLPFWSRTGIISLYRCRLTTIRNHFVKIRSLA